MEKNNNALRHFQLKKNLNDPNVTGNPRKK